MASKTKAALFCCGIFLCLAVLTAGCNYGRVQVPTPTVNAEATRVEALAQTQAAETLSAALTQSAQGATLTASAPTATNTAPPTRTAAATITPTPFLFTAIPTDGTLTPEASRIILPSVTTAVPMWSCNIISTDPYYKTSLRKGQAFEARWELLNSGENTWFGKKVHILYRNGYPMHTTDGKSHVSGSVDTGEIYEVVVPMKAPLESGAYSTVWILTNDKDEAFCWFTIDIVVE
mgnify:CR=1 FL=1